MAKFPNYNFDAHNASFDIFGAKNGRFFTAKSALKFSRAIENWTIVQKSIVNLSADQF